jgi:hypothetical protein
MQGFPPPRPRPLGPSPLVPVQQTPPGADGASAEVAPARERPGVPAPRPEPADSPRAGPAMVRSRATQQDAVVFTAPCPACGADCDWTEQREDTRLRTVVSCPCG